MPKYDRSSEHAASTYAALMCWLFWALKVKVKSFSRVWLFATPWASSLPGFSLHGILQARVLEWVAISFSRGSSRPRDRTHVSRIPGRRFNLWATGEGQGPWKTANAGRGLLWTHLRQILPKDRYSKRIQFINPLYGRFINQGKLTLVTSEETRSWHRIQTNFVTNCLTSYLLSWGPVHLSYKSFTLP